MAGVSKDLVFRIQADGGAAEKAFGQISRAATREMGKVSDELIDGESKGKQYAKALGRMADDIETELEGAERAGQALGNELGPELRKKLGQNGIDNLIRDMRNAGLEFEDVERDAKDLADEVKRLDRLGAKVDIEADADDAKDDIDKVGDELRKLDGDTAKVKIDADGAKNFADAIGGIPGPLGSITDALGTGGTVAVGAGVIAGGLLAAAGYASDLAIDADTMSRLTGDTVQYASALQSVWKSSGADINDLNDVVLQMNGVLADNPDYAKQLGVNLGDGATIGQRFVEVVDKIGKANLNAADKAKLMSAVFGEEGVRQVAALTSVIEGDLSDAVDGVSEQNLVNPDDVERAKEMKQEVAQLQADFSAAAAELGQTMLPLLTKAADLASKITEGLPGGGANSPINPMGRANEIDELIEKYGDVITVTYDAEKSQQAWDDQVRRGVATGQLWNGILKALNGDVATVTGTLDTNKVAAKVNADQQQQLADAQQRVADKALEQAEALKAASEQFLTAADATLAAEAAQDTFIEAAQESNQLIKDGKEGSEEYADAIDAERDAMIGSAQAAVRQKEEFWKAQGVTITAKGKLDDFNDSLLANAQYATPAARDAISDYIIEANGVPASKSTDIKAAIARGDFDTAKRLLDEASRARTAAIDADAHTADAEGELNHTARDRDTTIRVRLRKDGGITWIGPGNQIMSVYDSGTPSAPAAGMAGERRPEFVNGQLVTGPTMVPQGTEVVGGMDTRRLLEAQARGAGGQPVQIHLSVTVNAGVISNKFDMQRIVLEALDGFTRANGPRRLQKLAGIA